MRKRDRKSGRVPNPSVTLAHVDDDESAQIPTEGRQVTANQVVAWNLAWYRRAAGLTQKQLGDLIGWTNTAVSEAERSWDGKRVREFDAQALVQICLALSVPLIALFLPPQDRQFRYAFPGPGGGQFTMRDLMEFIVMPDNADDSPVMEAYRTRIYAAADHFLDREWAREIGRWLHETSKEEELAGQAASLRARQESLLEAAAAFGDIAAELETRRRQP